MSYIGHYHYKSPRLIAYLRSVAYHSGITSAVSFSSNSGVIGGLSTAFRPGAMHAMQYGAIIQNIVALHVKIAKPLRSQDVSVNSQISGLRSLLYGWEGTESETGMFSLSWLHSEAHVCLGKWFKRASEVRDGAQLGSC